MNSNNPLDYKINKGSQDSFHREYDTYSRTKNNAFYSDEEVEKLEKKLLSVYDITTKQLKDNKFVYIRRILKR